MTGMPDKDAIRQLIREVIAEEVKHLKATKAMPVAVAITSDADLAAFARDVLKLAENPNTRAAILDCQHPFHLARQSAGHAAREPSASRAASVSNSTLHRIDVGIVTEAIIASLPVTIRQLQLGSGVNITPLARDKARSRKITVERIGQ